MAGENPALGVVAAEYFRELQSRSRRQPPEIGLLVRFMQRPLDFDFQRRTEAPGAPLASKDDAYRVWLPPRDSSWHKRRKAAETAEDKQRRIERQRLDRQAEQARLAAERERMQRRWASLTADEQAAIRRAAAAECNARPDGVPLQFCQAWASRLLDAVEDRTRYELYGPDELARFERHAAAAYPLFFGSERTRIAAVLMAADYLERMDRSERRTASRTTEAR